MVVWALGFWGLWNWAGAGDNSDSNNCARNYFQSYSVLQRLSITKCIGGQLICEEVSVSSVNLESGFFGSVNFICRIT